MGFFGKPSWKPPLVLNETPVRCPQCSSDRPVFTMLDLRSFWFDAIGVRHDVTGYRVQCQECAHIFSIDKRGTFKHNRKCYPEEAAPQPPQRQEGQPPTDDDVDPHPIGVPYKRPDV